MGGNYETIYLWILPKEISMMIEHIFRDRHQVSINQVFSVNITDVQTMVTPGGLSNEVKFTLFIVSLF